MARIAFIGLGHMGGGMAPNLAKAGHEVRAFDLVPEAVAHAVRGRGNAPASTIDVASAREVGEEMKAKGFDFVDAPVSGGIAAAAAGTLALMVGGTDAQF